MSSKVQSICKPKIDIQRFDIGDYDEIYSLWMDTAGVGLRSIDDSREGIARFLVRNTNTNFIAKINGEIIGTILCGHDGRRGYIYHLTVRENMRKQGIGRALVDEAIMALKKEGITKVALCAFNNNRVGNEFWERVGFSKRDDLTYRNMNIINQQ